MTGSQKPPENTSGDSDGGLAGRLLLSVTVAVVILVLLPVLGWLDSRFDDLLPKPNGESLESWYSRAADWVGLGTEQLTVVILALALLVLAFRSFDVVAERPVIALVGVALLAFPAVRYVSDGWPWNRLEVDIALTEATAESFNDSELESWHQTMSDAVTDKCEDLQLTVMTGDLFVDAASLEDPVLGDLLLNADAAARQASSQCAANDAAGARPEIDDLRRTLKRIQDRLEELGVVS